MSHAIKEENLIIQHSLQIIIEGAHTKYLCMQALRLFGKLTSLIDDKAHAFGSLPILQKVQLNQDPK